MIPWNPLRPRMPVRRTGPRPLRASVEGSGTASSLRAAFLVLGLPVLAAGCGAEGGSERSALQPRYEVWIVDQSDSDHVGRFGGTLYVFDGAELEAPSPGSVLPRDRVDLGGGTATLCREETGADPVRPHMLLFNREGTHAVLSFVVSGHVAILDAERREPVACFRTEAGAGGSRQAHAAFPAPDGSYVIIANQNGKLLERIDTDFAAGRFTYNPEATLDLANGETPAGFLREDAEMRPDNAPICPVIDGESRYAWVTLRGGGLFVVDTRATPMRIVAEYDRTTVVGNGCGGVEARGAMYVNSGGSPVNLQGEDHPILHLHGFDVYRFPLSGYDSGEPNLPAPERVFSVEGEADSHGMVAVRGDALLWVADRRRNVIEVLEVGTGRHVRTIPLAGELSDDPAPDLLDVSPSGDRVFASFRGAIPLSGDPHNASGTTPGLGILEVSGDGTDGRLIGISGFSNVHQFEDVADPHAVRVRHIP